MIYTEAMENKNVRYPFKFTPLMLVLFLLGLVLCVGGFSLTLWRFLDFVQGDLGNIYGWIQYVLLFFVSVFLAALIISMLIRSQYVITQEHLILQFGFIKQKYELSRIVSVHLFKGLGKLAVYFDDFKTKYAVIVVKESWYDDFAKQLIERNPKIGFSFSTPEEEEEFKNRKS